MVHKKVCIFVDGENFRHAIVSLLQNFNQQDYLPREANWRGLFDWLAQEASDSNCERVRTYWYVVQDIDFRPYKIPNKYTKLEQIRKFLSQDVDIKAELKDLSEEECKKRMLELVKELRLRENNMRKRKNGWEKIQNNISSDHSAIEFRRAGSIVYDLFKKSLGIEKALDVKLAVDLIILRDIYDVAVIVSGDQDYVPAVNQIKNYGKRVVNVVFQTRSGKKLPGGAWRLNCATDDSITVPYEKLTNYINCIEKGG